MKKITILFILSIVIFTGCHDFVNEIDPFRGLVAFYRLEGSGINSADFGSAFISNGELIPGHLDNDDSAYYLDGEDGSYIGCGSLGKISEENPEMSISLWFMVESGTSVDNESNLIAKARENEDGYYVDFTGGRPTFKLFMDDYADTQLTVSADSSYVDDNWHLLNITAKVNGDSTTTKMYIDKVLQGTASDDEVPNGSDLTPLTIGAFDFDSAGMPVSVDNIKIHNFALSVLDVAKMYEDDEEGRTSFDDDTLVKAVSSGSNHSLFLKRNGEVWGSGSNSNGQLASAGSTYTPKQINGISGVTAVAAGNSFSLALKSDGTVWGWGRNQDTYHQLGLGDSEILNITTPTQITGLSDITKIAAGNNEAMAMDKDGNVYIWGYNVGSTPVIFGSSGCTDIAAGNGFFLMLNSDGTVSSMGNNVYGQLGDGTGTTEELPYNEVKTVTDLGNVTAVAAGENFSVALDSSGRVWCWGSNSDGQLGHVGVYGTSTEPVTADDLSGVKQVAVSANSVIALFPSGSIASWGSDSYGELVLDSSSDYYTPQYPDLPRQAAKLGNVHGSVGHSHFAITESGELMGWGSNTSGMLGNGSSAYVYSGVSEIPYF